MNDEDVWEDDPTPHFGLFASGWLRWLPHIADDIGTWVGMCPGVSRTELLRTLRVGEAVDSGVIAADQAAADDELADRLPEAPAWRVVPDFGDGDEEADAEEERHIEARRTRTDELAATLGVVPQHTAADALDMMIAVGVIDEVDGGLNLADDPPCLARRCR